MARYYSLALPVFKQGDDLHYRIEKNPDLKSAFKDQAEVYEEAAKMCRRMAGIAAENEDLEVDAEAHSIWVRSDNILQLEALVGDGVLDAQDWDEEEGDEIFEEECPETERNPVK